MRARNEGLGGWKRLEQLPWGRRAPREPAGTHSQTAEPGLRVPGALRWFVCRELTLQPLVISVHTSAGRRQAQEAGGVAWADGAR